MNDVSYERPNKPAYIELYERLKEDIVNGLYPFGTRLPSKRTMASETGLSTITVKHAYELLCDEGYLEAKVRSGHYVAFRAEDGFAATARPASVPARGASARPESLLPFSVLTKTMRRVMSEHGEMIFKNPPNKGCDEPREALRAYLARNRGIYIDAEQIILGSGAEYLYSLIVGLFGNDTVFALESPSYEKIEQVYKMAGVRCEMLPLTADGIESKALNLTSADVLHISPYRSFPSGITASASKKYEYIRWADKRGRFIIEDDFESEFSVSKKPTETMFSLSENDNVVYMNTFSKTISQSLRMGYMVLPKCLLDIFDTRLGFISCTVPTFEQLVIAQLINSGDFERHINRVRRSLRRDIAEQGRRTP